VHGQQDANGFDRDEPAKDKVDPYTGGAGPYYSELPTQPSVAPVEMAADERFPEMGSGIGDHPPASELGGRGPVSELGSPELRGSGPVSHAGQR
jgi:hypothetical protein